MNRPKPATIPCGALVLPLLLTAAFAQQDDGATKAAAARAAELHIAMTTKVDGAPVPRLAKGGKETGAHNWTGRVLEWRVGEKALTTKVALVEELARIAADPASLRVSEYRPGTKELLPVVVEPDPGVRWGEILELFDTVMAGRFSEWHLAGAGTIYFVPKMIAEPVRGGGAVVVPRATYNEPDDQPDAGRREFVVRQDGSIAHDDRVLFRWRAGKDEDLADLRRELLAMRAKDEMEGRIEERGPGHQKRLKGKVLIVADRWCEWRDVRRLMQALTAADVGFWKFEIGVLEAAVRPLPEEAAAAGKE
ncbi:MAG: hypothetical protein U1E73_06315 [Planctomycetota bacterium]